MMFSINSLTEKIGLRSGATDAASAAGSGFAHWAADMASTKAQPATPNRNMGIRICPPNRQGEAYRKRASAYLKSSLIFGRIPRPAPFMKISERYRLAAA
jgi:hypothetical protein